MVSSGGDGAADMPPLVRRGGESVRGAAGAAAASEAACHRCFCDELVCGATAGAAAAVGNDSGSVPSTAPMPAAMPAPREAAMSLQQLPARLAGMQRKCACVLAERPFAQARPLPT